MRGWRHLTDHTTGDHATPHSLSNQVVSEVQGSRKMALRGAILLVAVLVNIALVTCESNENLAELTNDNDKESKLLQYLQELYLKSLLKPEKPSVDESIDDGDDVSAGGVMDQRFSSLQDDHDTIHDDKRFSEFLGGKRKRFSEFLGGKRKRFSEFLGGKKRFSEFLGGKRKRFSEFLGGKKRFSEFLGGKRKRFSEFLGGKRSSASFDEQPAKRFSEFLGGR